MDLIWYSCDDCGGDGLHPVARAALAEAPQSGEVPPIASESGDPGWRPCLERSPGGMFCNANRGHAGPHAAYGPHADAPLATWPTDPEVKP